MRGWTSVAGSALAILLMVAVLYSYGGDLREVEISGRALIPSLIGSIAVYTIVVLIGAVAWRKLLQAFGATPAPWAAERQLLVSQIGKYLPGNVAQYLGRAAMAINSGVPAKTVGLALVAETVGIFIGACVAVAIAIAAAPALAGEMSRLLPSANYYVWWGLGLTTLFILLAGISFASKASYRWPDLLQLHWTNLAVAMALYVIALLLLGVSLHLVAGAVAISAIPLSLSIAVFSMAWIVGLITPGAPGGLGVRESVITIGLAATLGGATALSIALLHRSASVLGDLLSFGIGLSLPKNRHN